METPKEFLEVWKKSVNKLIKIECHLTSNSDYFSVEYGIKILLGRVVFQYKKFR